MPVVIDVDIRLLERELPGPVVLRWMRAVGRVAARRLAESRRRETRYRGTHAERSRRALNVVPLIPARRCEQHRRRRENRI